MLEVEVSKSIMLWIMPIFDISMAMLFCYMGLTLTRDFGFGDFRRLLLLSHRLMLFGTSIAMAYHALDIWQDPVRHGLTFSNFVLHASLVVLVMISSARMIIAERPQYRGGNGDVFSGPFRRRVRPNIN